MDWTTAGPYAVALLALIGTIATGIFQRRTARDAHQVSEAAGIIAGYDLLVKRLEAEIVAKGHEIADLRARLCAMEQREREWAEERDGLRCRIAKLERERNELKEHLEDLKARYCARRE